MTDEMSEEIDKISAGRYVKLSKLEEKKAHRFRFVGPGVSGWVVWDESNKPHRYQMKPSPSEFPKDVKREDDGSIKLQHFVGGLVWDYQEEEFRLMIFTQKSLKEDLNRYYKHDAYGDPTGYDIEISREGTGLQTKYKMVALPPKDLAGDIQAAFEEFNYDLGKYMAGEDPFAEE